MADRRQVIIWTNDGQVYRHINASLHLNELFNLQLPNAATLHCYVQYQRIMYTIRVM